MLDIQVPRMPATEREPDPAPAQVPEPVLDMRPVRLSRWSRVLLGVCAALIGLVTAAQLAAMMVAASPTNTLSRQYSAQLNWWVEPWLGQSWKLFGPRPQMDNLTILVRVRDASGAQSGWIDLTAMDYSAVLHDPMPSHANENELRLAWNAYENSRAGGAVQGLTRRYLTNFAAERLGLAVPGRYTAVQFESVSTPMPPPGTTGPQPPTNQYLPWWPLAAQNGAKQ
jgi:hypothetical protein